MVEKVLRVPVGFALSTLMAITACTTAGDAPDQLSWDEFRADVYQEPATGVFVVDGDIALENETQLRAFYDRHAASWAHGDRGDEPLAEQSQPLIVNRAGGQDDRWAHVDTRNLNYCVSTAFGVHHGTVVEAMRQATADWQAHGNVFFRHRNELDGGCNAATSGVVFDVSPVASAPYIARAFFPSYARVNRNVLINTQYINGSGVWSLRGILRHELGHTLGFRHEHTRPESRACFEDNNWGALTRYDPASVMHYPQCNGTQTGDLVITGLDAEGMRVAYGPRPVRGLDVVDYLTRYGDLTNAFGATNWPAAATHWENHGVAEGRRGATELDAPYYLALYPDLRAAFGDTNYPAARWHWLNYGIHEGRRASREFDAPFYLSHHPDLVAAFGATNYGAALDHWLTYGIHEGRRSAADFDVHAYLHRYPDLLAAFGDTNHGAALFHWLTYGMGEGRNPAP
jgi:hypothetical protein